VRKAELAICVVYVEEAFVCDRYVDAAAADVRNAALAAWVVYIDAALDCVK